MALAQAVMTFLALCGFFLGFASLGNLILRTLKWKMASDGEHVLVAIAVGLISAEVLLFLIQTTQLVKLGSVAIAALLCALLLEERKPIWAQVRGVLRQVVPSSTLGWAFFVLIVIVASLEFLASQAPLTGSDALHYHFTAQKQILELGFHPNFSDSNSFLCGQHHLLILLGLALGSERLALGFIFFGGILTAAALVYLISQSASWRIGAGFSLLFLLTPVVFWQISTSGAPDIFMAFLTCVTLLVLRKEEQIQSWRQVLLAGFLTGGIAGAKYTGCVIAAALVVAVAIEFRSVMQVSLFIFGLLCSGIWTYLRNLAWTGNPVFPFLSAKLSPHLVTTYGLAHLASSTGASTAHHPWQLIPFVLLAGAQEQNPGLWDFFGPTVVVLAPLMLFGFKNTRAWRIPILFWFLSGLGIFFASGLPRFLLPVFPIALSCVAAGFETSLRQRWTIASRVVALLLILITVAGAGGLAIYVQKPLLAAIGLQNKRTYLEQRTQDYEIVEATNRLLSGLENRQKALVFVRHLYYLDIPYLNGNPDTSFEVDPKHLRTTQEWKAFLEGKRIGYVVRSPDYPEAIATPLREMEESGDLIPFAQAVVQNFQGKRIDEELVGVPVVILKVGR